MEAVPVTPDSTASRPRALRRGFLDVGPLVTAALLAAEYLQVSRSDGIHPGWWILYPLVYLASSTMASWLAALAGRVQTSAPSPSPGLASRWWPLLPGGALAGFAMFMLLLPGTRHGDYMLEASRYVLTVVDAVGQPVAGARVRLLEAGRDGVPPATPSDLGLGMYVLADAPLTNADGQLVIEQPWGAARSSRTTYTLLGIAVAERGRRGSRTLSVERDGYRAATLSLDELDGDRSRRRRRRLELGKDGNELFRSDVRLVLEPVAPNTTDYGGR
ncbi:MAG: hypothetical protein AB7T63_02325 [Planctomycetota bacterium]